MLGSLERENQVNKLFESISSPNKTTISLNNENAQNLNTLLTRTNLIAISIISFILGFIFT
jgi:hypothetical protein